MRNLLVLLFFGASFNALTQDTIRIYFKYGSANVNDINASMLRTLHNDYDLRDVEYAEFIGYADSTGDFTKNKSLSEKRARNVLKYCKKSFSSDTEIKILARGEDVKIDQAENRRVEIILYYPAEIEPPKKDIIVNVDPKCFYIDTDALKYCNVKEIKKRGRRFMYIEALPVDLFKTRQHYYSARTKLGGKTTIQRVRWKMKTTGKLWWRKKRWVAIIPRASFIQYQFFTLEDAPCSGCTEEIFTKDTIVLTVEKYFPDYFLMQNIQAKVRLFNHHQVKIRAPKEYVDLKAEYGIREDYFNGNYKRNRFSRIDWTTKKGFRGRKEDYYFTTVNLYNKELDNIKQKRMTTICLNAPVWDGEGWWNNPMNCGTGNLNGWALGLKGVFEPGVFYHNDTLTGYVALGLAFTKRINLQVVAGINTHKGFYSALSFRYPFLNFRLNALSLKNKWISPTMLAPSVFESPIIHIYSGLDAKTSYNKKYQSFLESNLHLGLAIDKSIFGIYTEFYLQGGAAFDFLQRINNKIYPYGQFGIRFYARSII
ncbi:OmpA family protein [Crocinitomix catalasitica]|uniref:OmpA family protein n=1 Tax=Crocinitomix catalasitica TaxID=184607 RepID=UPI0004864E34|nr:OmpA family protein [Crocinitomix catalasitica]